MVSMTGDDYRWIFITHFRQEQFESNNGDICLTSSRWPLDNCKGFSKHKLQCITLRLVHCLAIFVKFCRKRSESVYRFEFWSIKFGEVKERIGSDMVRWCAVERSMAFNYSGCKGKRFFNHPLQGEHSVFL